jgi:hypothetical protein
MTLKLMNYKTCNICDYCEKFRCGFVVIFRGAEVQIGNGKTAFPCLNDCVAEFSLKTLQVCNWLPSCIISFYTFRV